MLNPKSRKRLAYYTAFKVAWSYLWLNFKSRFLGEAYKQKKRLEIHQKNAELVKNTLLELQGLFIKFGQLLSILANVLPPAFRTPLASLQDTLPARSYQQVSNTFFISTGKKINTVFDTFEETPIAAASIGQVHLATRKGIRYAVKIQHADIEQITEADLTILKNLIIFYSWFMEIKGADYIYQQLTEMIQQELDYQQEAIAMQRIAKSIEQQASLNIMVPEVDLDLTTQKVLVTTFFEGENIANLEQLAEWNLDPEEIAERILLLFAYLILKEGYYHADPHPGNLLINKTGQIALLDFGAVATLGDNLRTGMPELIEAIIRNDHKETIMALNKMGFLIAGAESQQIAERLILIGRHFLEQEVQLNGLDFSSIKLKSGMKGIFDLFQAVSLKDISNSIQIPKDCILFYRTVILVFGLSLQLAPKHNPLDTLRPFIKQQGLIKTELKQTLLLAAKRQLATALALPAAFEDFLKKANQNKLTIKVQDFNQNIQKIYYLGQQFLFAFIGGFAYVMADNGRGDFFFWITGLCAFLFLKASWLGRIKK